MLSRKYRKIYYFLRENEKIIIKFIDSYIFMSTSSPNLVDNLSGIYDKECKKCMERKKIRLNCEFIGFKNGRLNYKCKECKKSYTKLTNESIKNFPTLQKFCNGDLDKFFLVLRKGIYPYEYMDSWERFDENTILPKEAFHSELNLEAISDADYEHFKKVWESFEIKNLSIMICMFNAIQYCLLMFLKTLQISVLKYMNLILLIFCLDQD